MRTAYIALGSNIGDRHHFLRLALQFINQLPDTQLIRVSSVYQSAALTTDGSSAPDFLNAVCAVETKLLPFILMRRLQLIENRCGRLRWARWAPRTLDLDLIDYVGWQQSHPWLNLPHPELAQRRFVLEPLQEIAPQWRHPTTQKSVQELLEALADLPNLGKVRRCFGLSY